jgi:hypothetical protein
MTTQQLYRIIGPDGVVGEPGPAGPISDRCSALNDAANPDPEAMRQVLYKVEKAPSDTGS